MAPSSSPAGGSSSRCPCASACSGARGRCWSDCARSASRTPVAEQLGHETYAYFRVSGLDAAPIGERPVELAGALAARLDPRTNAAPGQEVALAVDLDEVHLFDPESRQSILGD
jgi:hypothetical protein